MAQPATIRFIDLGRVPYGQARQRQQQLHQQVLHREVAPTVLLLEHDPVITVSQRRNARNHLLSSQQTLHAAGITVAETDRGGDITYHGPGQLIAYPVLRLADLKLNVSRYMHLLEQVVIDTLEKFDLRAHRIDKTIGIWVEPNQFTDPAHAPDRPAKVCALGVRVRRNVTQHGLALNVTTDLSHFTHIIPCGLADAPVTSLAQILGPGRPTLTEVKRTLRDTFIETYRRQITGHPPMTLDLLQLYWLAVALGWAMLSYLAWRLYRSAAARPGRAGLFAGHPLGIAAIILLVAVAARIPLAGGAAAPAQR